MSNIDESIKKLQQSKGNKTCENCAFAHKYANPVAFCEHGAYGTSFVVMGSSCDWYAGHDCPYHKKG